jgi:hypothetical protein
MSVYQSFKFFLLCLYLFVRVCECVVGLASQKMDASVFPIYVHFLFFQLFIRVVMVSGVCEHVSRIHVYILWYLCLCTYQRIVCAYTYIFLTCLFVGRSILVVLSVRSCE